MFSCFAAVTQWFQILPPRASRPAGVPGPHFVLVFLGSDVTVTARVQLNGVNGSIDAAVLIVPVSGPPSLQCAR